jgi:hypothetical protein
LADCRRHFGQGLAGSFIGLLEEIYKYCRVSLSPRDRPSGKTKAFNKVILIDFSALFLANLVNDIVSSSHCVELNDSMILKNEFE